MASFHENRVALSTFMHRGLHIWNRRINRDVRKATIRLCPFLRGLPDDDIEMTDEGAELLEDRGVRRGDPDDFFDESRLMTMILIR
jgi:hypothetical protein